MDCSTSRARRERFEALYVADDAADAVAETFVVAWRRLDDVPGGDAARLWLYGTARRVLANQERSSRRRHQLSERVRAELRDELLELATPVDVTPAALALSRLAPDDRELLRLSAWEGLDAGEIAAIFGSSRNAIRIRLHRARRRLVRELSRSEAADDGTAGRATQLSGLIEREDCP